MGPRKNFVFYSHALNATMMLRMVPPVLPLSFEMTALRFETPISFERFSLKSGRKHSLHQKLPNDTLTQLRTKSKQSQ